MKQILLSAFLFLMAAKVQCQINISDSTSQVVGYWDKNESQKYTVTNEKIKIRGNDTISKQKYQYDVDISITDSTENGYEVNWYYHDFKIDPKDEVMNKLSSLLQNMNVQIRTDKLGTFKEVVNWLELKNYIMKGISLMKKEYSHIPNMDKFLSQIEVMYSSKEDIESGAIDEILQYYYFHGLKYKLNQEYTYDSKLNNRFGGQPFDSKVSFSLDEINTEDNNCIYRMYESVDSVQLTNETFKYMTKMAETFHSAAPNRDNFPFLHNETWIDSRIHDSGWVLYSIKTKEVTAEDVIQIDECVIELK